MREAAAMQRWPPYIEMLQKYGSATGTSVWLAHASLPIVGDAARSVWTGPL